MIGTVNYVLDTGVNSSLSLVLMVQHGAVYGVVHGVVDDDHSQRECQLLKDEARVETEVVKEYYGEELVLL